MSRHSLAKCLALFAKILNREGNITATSGLIHELNWHPGKSGNGLVASPPPCAVNLYLRVMLAEGLQSISARIDWLVALEIVCSWNPGDIPVTIFHVTRTPKSPLPITAEAVNQNIFKTTDPTAPRIQPGRCLLHLDPSQVDEWHPTKDSWRGLTRLVEQPSRVFTTFSMKHA